MWKRLLRETVRGEKRRRPRTEFQHLKGQLIMGVGKEMLER